MNDRVQWYFFLGICAVVVGLSYFVFQPFLSTIAVAIFLAVIFYPLQRRVAERLGGRQRLSAGIIVLGSLMLVLVPLSWLSAQLVKEARGVYEHLQDADVTYLEQGALWLENLIRGLIPQFSFSVSAYLDAGLAWAQSHVGVFVLGTIEGVFLTVLTLFLFYYFLYNGERMRREVVKLSPLPDRYDRRIFTTVKATADSVLRGTLLIAIIQGVLVGMGLWLFGVPNPILLGSAAALSALVPGIGTGLVLIPAVLYLFAGGETVMAVSLAVWGAVVVGLVDNFLVPYFYGQNIRVHPVFVLLAVLGGLGFFGFLGFIFGPILLSLLIVLIDIYRLIIRSNALAPAEKK